MALQNIETLNDLGITKIITQCPHCFNTLGNEYPQFGGDYEVIHHSELLMSLVTTAGSRPARQRRDRHLPRPLLPGSPQ